MPYQLVSSIPQRCSYCGQGPWYPREEDSKDPQTGETITEARWICHNCGGVFKAGITRVTPAVQDKNEK